MKYKRIRALGIPAALLANDASFDCCCDGCGHDNECLYYSISVQQMNPAVFGAAMENKRIRALGIPAALLANDASFDCCCDGCGHDNECSCYSISVK